MPASSPSVEAQGWAAGGARGHWSLGLGRAAEQRWLKTRRRRGIAGRRPARQRLLPDKLRCEGDRLEPARIQLLERPLQALKPPAARDLAVGLVRSPFWERAEAYARSQLEEAARKLSGMVPG